jgi:hypothetical protein
MWVVMSTAAEHEKFLADVHVGVLNIRTKDKPSSVRHVAGRIST